MTDLHPYRAAGRSLHRESPAGAVSGLLPGQLPAALGFELTALSPRAVNLAGRITASKGDDGRDEGEHKRADGGDDLQDDYDSNNDRNHGENCFHWC